MSLLFVPGPQVDRAAYARLAAAQGNLYQQPWYLDLVAPRWGLLAQSGEAAGQGYDFAFPMGYKSLGPLRRVYQPFFTQTFSPLGMLPPDSEWASALLAASPWAHFSLEGPVAALAPYLLRRRSNYVLPIAPSYAQLRAGYHTELRRELKRPVSVGPLSLAELPQFVAGLRTHVGPKVPALTATHYAAIAAICGAAAEQAELVGLAARNAQGRWLAANIAVRHQQRVYLLFGYNTPEGRACHATAHIFDHLIERFSGQDLVLDFEGSSIAPIAFFFGRFGAVAEPYYTYGWNRLPWPLSTRQP
jgi:hypothetical protein